MNNEIQLAKEFVIFNATKTNEAILAPRDC